MFFSFISSLFPSKSELNEKEEGGRESEGWIGDLCTLNEISRCVDHVGFGIAEILKIVPADLGQPDPNPRENILAWPSQIADQTSFIQLYE